MNVETFRNEVVAQGHQLTALLAKIRRHHRGAEVVVVLALGGLGDAMRGAALCKAIQREAPGAVLVCIASCTRTLVEEDILESAKAAGALHHYTTVGHGCREHLLETLLPACNRLYECGVMGRAFHRVTSAKTAQLQVQADQRVTRWMLAWAEYPRASQAFNRYPFDQWKLLSSTTGIEVSQDDLVPPRTLAEVDPKLWPDEWLERLGKDEGPGVDLDHPYVLLHSSCGAQSASKEIPLELLGKIVTQFSEKGVATVQVGPAADPKIPGVTVDYRGYRLPHYATIIDSPLCIGMVAMEGLWAYLMRSFRKNCMVFFTCTPRHLFAMEGCLALTNATCRACWWETDDWGVAPPCLDEDRRQLLIGGEKRTKADYCQNIPSAEDVAEAVNVFVASTAGREEVGA